MSILRIYDTPECTAEGDPLEGSGPCEHPLLCREDEDMSDHGEDWWDRRLAAESASREPTEFRRDGWPLCPTCGDDELYSLATPPSADAIDGCYRCGPAHPLAKPAPYRRCRVGSAAPLRLVRRDNSG